MPGETIKASDVRLGDILVYYGVAFEIVSAACYPGLKGEEQTMPCYVYQTRLLAYPGPSCAMPRAWAETWTFQGNDRATWTRLAPEEVAPFVAPVRYG